MLLFNCRLNPALHRPKDSADDKDHPGNGVIVKVDHSLCNGRRWVSSSHVPPPPIRMVAPDYLEWLTGRGTTIAAGTPPTT